MDVADPRAHRDIPSSVFPPACPAASRAARPSPGQLGLEAPARSMATSVSLSLPGRAVVVRQGTEQAQIQTVGGHNFRFHRVGNPAFDGADKYRTGEDALRPGA